MEYSINIKELDKQTLIDIFEKFLEKSNFSIKSRSYSDNPYNVKIDDGVRKFDVYFVLKNLSNGGWKNKEDIKRIQIGNIKDSLVSTNKIRTYMLCGIANINNDYILIVWDAYLYVNHTTNRSCYVRVDSIKKCLEKGYVFIHDFDQEFWLCDLNNFGLLIRDYINYNYLE